MYKMTSRNNSTVMTHAIREQFDYHRHEMQKQLASQVLSIVGIRHYRAQPYVTTKDIFKKEESLMQLLGPVRAWYTAKERQRLYKNCAHLGMSLTKLILSSVGHPLSCSDCRIDANTTCCKFSLDPAVLAATTVMATDAM
jgi:hypothetical protein